MKKFTKVILIIAAVFFCIGIVCLIGSFSLGLTWGSVSRMVKDGKFEFSISKFSDKTNQDDKLYFDTYCRDLDIELGSGMLEVKYHDSDQICVQQKNEANYKCYVEDATLYIEGDRLFNIGENNGKVILWLPEDMEFQEVDIEVGSGKADIRDMCAKELDIKVGAGTVNMSVVGKPSDYHYEIECGVGSIRLGEDTYAGIGYEKESGNFNASRQLSVECGAGTIQVDFSK